MSIHDMCHPCLVKYNYIAKLETINPDSTFLLYRTSNKFPELTDSVQESNLKNMVHKYYSSVPSKVLDGIRKLYALDFEMFGYDINEVWYNGTRFWTESGNFMLWTSKYSAIILMMFDIIFSFWKWRVFVIFMLSNFLRVLYNSTCICFNYIQRHCIQKTGVASLSLHYNTMCCMHFPMHCTIIQCVACIFRCIAL